MPGLEVPDDLLREALSDRIKTEVDQIARHLMLLRMEKKDANTKNNPETCRSSVHASPDRMA
jgi:hypothetical protein